MSSLFGRKVAESTKVQNLVKELVNEVQSINSGIKTIQPANPEMGDNAKKWIDKAGTFRGRPLHYPYVGSGSGRGVYVELEDGSIKLDLINGIGIHLFGHGHPKIMEAAVRGALSDVVNQGNLEPNKEYVQYTEKLVSLASKNSKMKYAWFSTCGTMANENAVKLSRQKNSPARMIVAFKNAFAGRSTLMAEVTDNVAYKQGLPDYNEVLRIPWYDKNDPQSGEKTLNALKEHVAKHPGNICCFGFEPMLGEGGYMPATREFFIPLLKFCRENKIAVWADEVQTYMRTGELFAFETLGLGEWIDIVSIAKTAQLGATLYTEEYNPKPGLIAGTFSGTTVSMMAGMAMLDVLTTEGYLGPKGRIQEIHTRFIGGLNKLAETTCKGKISDAGGMGLMMAFTAHDGKKESATVFLNKLFANGVIAFPCGKDPIRARFLVPATILNEDIDLALQVIEKTLLEGV